MDWNTDISAVGKRVMKFLGNFGPVAPAQSRTVKGYMLNNEGGGKVYLYPKALRDIAAACNEVADWLDKRAEAEKGKEDAP